MSADAYLQQILNREAVDTGIFSPVRGVQATLEPTIREWANRFPHVPVVLPFRAECAEKCWSVHVSCSSVERPLEPRTGRFLHG